MDEIIFGCPQCQSKLAIDERGAGMVIDCPKCALEITIPHQSTFGSKTVVREAPAPEPQKERSQILTDLSRVRKQLEKEQDTALDSRRQFEAKLEKKAQQAEADRRHLERLLDQNKKQAQSMASNSDQLGTAQAEVTELRNKCNQLEQFAAQEKETLQEELEASNRREKELQHNAQEACTRIEDEYLQKLEISEREKFALREQEERALSERDHLLTVLDEQQRKLEQDTGNLNQRVLDLETQLSEEEERKELNQKSAGEEWDRLLLKREEEFAASLEQIQKQHDDQSRETEGAFEARNQEIKNQIQTARKLLAEKEEAFTADRERLEQELEQARKEIEHLKGSLRSESAAARKYLEEQSKCDQDAERVARDELTHQHALEEQRLQEDLSKYQKISEEKQKELEGIRGNLEQRIFDLETRLSEEQQERAMALWSAGEERDRLLLEREKKYATSLEKIREECAEEKQETEKALAARNQEAENQIQLAKEAFHVDFEEELSKRDKNIEQERKAREELAYRHALEQQRLQNELSDHQKSSKEKQTELEGLRESLEERIVDFETRLSEEQQEKVLALQSAGKEREQLLLAREEEYTTGLERIREEYARDKQEAESQIQLSKEAFAKREAALATERERLEKSMVQAGEEVDRLKASLQSELATAHVEFQKELSQRDLRIEQEQKAREDLASRQALEQQRHQNEVSEHRKIAEEKQKDLEGLRESLEERIVDLKTRLSEEQEEKHLAFASARKEGEQLLLAREEEYSTSLERIREEHARERQEAEKALFTRNQDVENEIQLVKEESSKREAALVVERERVEQSMMQAGEEIDRLKASIQSERATAHVEFQEELSQRDQNIEQGRKAREELAYQHALEQQRLQDELSDHREIAGEKQKNLEDQIVEFEIRLSEEQKDKDLALQSARKEQEQLLLAREEEYAKEKQEAEKAFAAEKQETKNQIQATKETSSKREEALVSEKERLAQSMVRAGKEIDHLKASLQSERAKIHVEFKEKLSKRDQDLACEQKARAELEKRYVAQQGKIHEELIGYQKAADEERDEQVERYRELERHRGNLNRRIIDLESRLEKEEGKNKLALKSEVKERDHLLQELEEVHKAGLEKLRDAQAAEIQKVKEGYAVCKQEGEDQLRTGKKELAEKERALDADRQRLEQGVERASAEVKGLKLELTTARTDFQEEREKLEDLHALEQQKLRNDLSEYQKIAQEKQRELEGIRESLNPRIADLEARLEKEKKGKTDFVQSAAQERDRLLLEREEVHKASLARLKDEHAVQIREAKEAFVSRDQKIENEVRLTKETFAKKELDFATAEERLVEEAKRAGAEVQGLKATLQSELTRAREEFQKELNKREQSAQEERKAREELKNGHAAEQQKLHEAFIQYQKAADEEREKYQKRGKELERAQGDLKKRVVELEVRLEDEQQEKVLALQSVKEERDRLFVEREEEFAACLQRIKEDKVAQSREVEEEFAVRMQEIELQAHSVNEALDEELAVIETEKEKQDPGLRSIESIQKEKEIEPPKTIQALAEEIGATGIPTGPRVSSLPATTSLVTENAESKNTAVLKQLVSSADERPFTSRSSKPSLPQDRESGSTRETAEYPFADISEETPLHLAPALFIGWGCMILGTATLTLRIAWLKYALIPLVLGLVLGWISLKRRQSPLVFGLFALSFLAPAVLLAGHYVAGFNGILFMTNPRLMAISSERGKSGSEISSGIVHAVDPVMNRSIHVGESTLVDGIKVTLDSVHIGPIAIKKIFGKAVALDKAYLILELTLENTSHHNSVYIEKSWERARLTDNFDNSSFVIDQQRLNLDHLEGALRSKELEPHEMVKDRMVFDAPKEGATSFRIISDPGFYRKNQNGLQDPISSDSLLIEFSYDEIGK